MLFDTYSAAPRSQYFPLDVNAYKTVALIGMGGYSLVRLVKLKHNNTYYAIKQIALCDIHDEYQLRLAVGEIEVFTATKSFTRLYSSVQRYYRDAGPGKDYQHYLRVMECIKKYGPQLLLECYAVWRDDYFLYYLLEFNAAHDLMSHLVRLKHLSERECCILLAQIAIGVGCMHDYLGFCHRDIKPDNILVNAHGRPVLADFGLTRSLPVVLMDQSKPVTREVFYSPMGTLEYMPVEVIRSKKPYNRTCDFWCLGILMYEILVGAMPFASAEGAKEELRAKILNHVQLLDSWPEDTPISVLALDVLKKLITEPENRFTNVYEMLSHPWFQQIDLSQLFDYESPLKIDIDSLEEQSFLLQYPLSVLYQWEQSKRCEYRFPDIVHHLNEFRVPYTSTTKAIFSLPLRQNLLKTKLHMPLRVQHGPEQKTAIKQKFYEAIFTPHDNAAQPKNASGRRAAICGDDNDENQRPPNQYNGKAIDTLATSSRDTCYEDDFGTRDPKFQIEHSQCAKVRAGNERKQAVYQYFYLVAPFGTDN